MCLGYINGVKVNFIVTALQFGHWKALVTDFIYHNQIFVRFWQDIPIWIFLSQAEYFYRKFRKTQIFMISCVPLEIIILFYFD